jgi:hypothetical protein
MNLKILLFIKVVSVHYTKFRLAQHDVNISTEKIQEIKRNLLIKISEIADYHWFTNLSCQIMPVIAFVCPAGTYKKVPRYD